MKKDIPGGSIGDRRMGAVYSPQTLSELRFVFENKFGYDSAHNSFFKQFLGNLTVADFGCGHGFSTLYLSDTAKYIVGFDIDCDAVDKATILRDKLGMMNVRFQCHEPYKTNYEKEFFDAVVSSDVIEHVNYPQLYLKEARRILKPDGLMLLSTPNGLLANGDLEVVRSHSPYHVMEYTPKQVNEMLVRAGFNVEAYLSQRITKRIPHPISYGTLPHILHYILNRMFETKFGRFAQIPFSIAYKSLFVGSNADSISNYPISGTEMELIAATNCDAILVKCRKAKT